MGEKRHIGAERRGCQRVATSGDRGCKGQPERDEQKQEPEGPELCERLEIEAVRVPGRLWHGAVSIPRAAVAAGTRAEQRLVLDRAQCHAPVVGAAAAGERSKACRSLGRRRRRRREGTGKRNSSNGHGEEEDCSADDDDAAVERTASRDKQSQQADRERKPRASRIGEVLRQGEQGNEQGTGHAQAPALGDEGEAEGQEHPHGREHRHAVRVADGLGEAVI